ncbi:MAG: hypothetical protein J5476_13910 [Lachnospiraceae bacterium]|nr:hypothetical protein [Lachnospiraceae bacterium]
MRTFLYYAVHTIINTIKKLFKTWLVFFFAIFIIAILVGIGVGTAVSKISETIEEETATEEQIEEDEDAPSGLELFMQEHDLDKAGITDLIVTAAFFFLITLSLLGADKSGQLFKPADVTLLFPSPMKPQSVLMFRLMLNLGLNLFLAVYMLFQLPNLIHNAGFSVWGSFSIIIAYGLVMAFSTLAQVTIYTVFSKGEGNKKKNIGTILLSFYVILGIALIIYQKVTNTDIATAAVRFFGKKNTFWIPFYGWLRGMVYFAVTGENTKSLIYMALFIIACIVLIFVIWKTDADFYEDAMYSAERMSRLVEESKNSAKGGIITREKKRSDKLERDGFHYGFGANVFFYKALMNRFRFSFLKIFSKTMVIGLAAAFFSAYLVKDNNIGLDRFIVPGSVLLMITFYRTLGNPLQEDLSREFFILVPSSELKKILYSLLGCFAVNAIDLVLPLATSAIMLKTSPLTVLCWFIFIMSVSVFGTSVGAFINISIPLESAQSIKAMVQIMFIYFGIIPAAVFVVIGIVLKQMLLFVTLGAIANCALGFLFILMSPRFLTNR